MNAPLELDVLAAIRYLHQTGAKRMSVVGASMGAGAAGDASIASRPGEIDRLVLLAGVPSASADQLKSPTLFIVTRDDSSGDGPRSPKIKSNTTGLPNQRNSLFWTARRTPNFSSKPIKRTG